MVYKNFYFQIIIRMLLIVITTIWFSFAIQNLDKIYTIIVIISLLLLQFFSIIRYINKTNKDLGNYFSAILNKDTSMTLSPESSLKSLAGLQQITKGYNELIKTTQIEKENHYQYLLHVFENVGIGLISIANENKIELMNKTAKALFDLPLSSSIKHINSIPPYIASVITDLKPNQQKILNIKKNDSIIPVLLRASAIVLKEKEIKLVSFQNVKQELEEKELESWQKLISVLTHEIMNSMTPITTLTLAIKKAISEDLQKNNNNDTLKDVLLNTEIIEKRSEGLIEFVSNYRDLTKIKSISPETFLIQTLFENVLRLFKKEFENCNIQTSIKIEPENLELIGDLRLIEQLMINLIKNSVEAIIEDRNNTIELIANRSLEGRTSIELIDNGKGIPKEQLDKIFIPFYTTKTNGSGIGLSLAHQIMRLHRGVISIKSELAKGTIVTLKF